MKAKLATLVPALIAVLGLTQFLDVSMWQAVLIGLVFGVYAGLADTFLFRG